MKNLLKNIFLNYFNNTTVKVKCNKKWYGTDYGGFYVCPDFLSETSIVYSFGLGEDISFDESIIQAHNCKVIGFDPTPKSIKYINDQKLPEKFIFKDWGVGPKSGMAKFFLPKNKAHVSGSTIFQENINPDDQIFVEIKSLKDIADHLQHKHIDLLKMDIEGAEYEVIDNIMESNIEIGQILIEFHDRLFKNGKIKTIDAISKLRSLDFEIFGVSKTKQEISFIHSKLLN